MGRDSRIIQATGGNTSLKQNGTLWVKASGMNLANSLEQNIFIRLDLNQVREHLHQRDPDNGFGFAKICHEDLRPSIETSLHALMPHRVVLHSHPIDVIALTLIETGLSDLSQALRDINWHFIPYSRPGHPLASEIARVMATEPADVLILANHGLVVGGSSPEVASALQDEVIRRVRIKPRLYHGPHERQLYKWLELLPGSRLPIDPVIHTLATDLFSLHLAKQNPPYPDHVVFCGMRPLIMTSAMPSHKVGAKYVLIPGVGVVLLESASTATEAMLKAQAEVYLRIPPGNKVKLLSHDQCAELLNWEAEKYRQSKLAEG